MNIDMGRYIDKFFEYITVLEYFMNKSYEIIYKDRILTYSLEATKLPDKEFNVVTEDFIRLTIKFMGPNIFNEMKNVYGNEDTLIFNMVEFFNTKYESDEIRKNSIDNIDTNEDNINTEV